MIPVRLITEDRPYNVNRLFGELGACNLHCRGRDEMEFSNNPTVTKVGRVGLLQKGPGDLLNQSLFLVT